MLCCVAHPLLLLPAAHQEVIKVVQPVILGKMIQYFESYDPEDKTALYETLGYAAGLSICTIGLAVLHHLYFYHVQRTGMKIRVAMCHMIYKKVSRRQDKETFLLFDPFIGVIVIVAHSLFFLQALCLSSSAMGKTTTGQIVNLLSNDVNRFDDVGETVDF